MYRVRKAETDADVDNIALYGRDFCNEGGWTKDVGYDPESVKAWTRYCADNGLALVVETDAGEFAGMAAAVFDGFFFNKAVLQGVELFWYVRPEHRRGDAGKLLFRAMEDGARAKGAKRWSMVALATCQPEKVGAVYERNGYTLSELSYTKVF